MKPCLFWGQQCWIKAATLLEQKVNLPSAPLRAWVWGYQNGTQGCKMVEFLIIYYYSPQLTALKAAAKLVTTGFWFCKVVGKQGWRGKCARI